eukprot:scaffold222_cov175-Amphora_coffeaeformis.AAC.15
MSDLLLRGRSQQPFRYLVGILMSFCSESPFRPFKREEPAHKSATTVFLAAVRSQLYSPDFAKPSTRHFRQVVVPLPYHSSPPTKPSTMNLNSFITILLSLILLASASAFTSVSTTSRSTQRNQKSSLGLLPFSFSVVSTAIAEKNHQHSSQKRDISTYDAYAYSESRPVYSFTDSSNILTPALEGVRQVFVDSKAAVSNLAQTASKLGVSFGLSYSLLSNINGAVTLAVSWYMTCQRTGVSPVYQWKALLKTYGAMYAFLQAIKPIRIAAAISMASHAQNWLDATQNRFQCGRSKAVAVQYVCGYAVQAIVASTGILIASTASGVPIFVSP